MCGIAGIFARPGTTISRSKMEAMRDALLHRGPDGDGIEIDEACGLVHTRLSIIDLETGRQPLRDTLGGVLVGNGEIYNYVELWPSIHNRAPRTHSDFEPPLLFLSDDGVSAVKRLRGMYAFAHASDGGRRGVLARDPFGIKPLYYMLTDEGVAFASEPRALFAANYARPVVRAAQRDELVDLHFTIDGATVFDGIERVAPGETISIRDGTIIGRERQTVPVSAPPLATDEANLVSRFDAVFENSVDVHRRADVPYALFLSSGIDSNAILAMLSRISRDPVLCFTAGFDDGDADERRAASKIARHFGAEHISVEFGADDFWQTLPQIAWALDDPTADYAALPTFKLAAEARRHVKVVLTGEGGDELFAGYGRYRRALRPWWLGGRQPRRRSAIEQFGLARAPVAWRTRPLPDRPEVSLLQRAQAADIADWLPNDILLKLDRCLMAHGVEGRTPFLDPKVAEFAASLPDEMKVRNGLGKWLLRKWTEIHCPPAEAMRSKSGFTVPVGRWIARRKSELAEFVSREAGVVEAFHPDAVRAVFLASEERMAGGAAWSLLFYAVWHAVHICGGNQRNDIFSLLAGAA